MYPSEGLPSPPHRNRASYLQRWTGRPVEVLFEEETWIDGKRWWSGHGRQYQRVLLAKDGDLSGEIVTVEPKYVKDGCLFD